MTLQNTSPVKSVKVNDLNLISATQYSGAAEIANNNFNYTYTSVLSALHNALNGNPEGLNSAIGFLESLEEKAKSMMSGRSKFWPQL